MGAEEIRERGADEQPGLDIGEGRILLDVGSKLLRGLRVEKNILLQTNLTALPPHGRITPTCAGVAKW